MWPGFLIDHMFFRKRHWHLISEWTLGLVNALNHHWCETSYYLELFWSMWCPEISFSRSLCMGPVLYPKEIYGIVLYLIFSMSFYITFKKKTLACGSQVGHMWVTSGLLCGSVGQVGQQVWSTFNPEMLDWPQTFSHSRCFCLASIYLAI